MDSDPSRDLAQQLAELTQRVGRIEQALQRHGGLNPEPIPSSPPSAVVTPSKKAVPPVTLRSLQAISEPKRRTQDPSATAHSLETQIGSQIFNRVGILAVLIGMAWFLKFAIDNHWIGPLGRILIGLVTGVGIILWSERFRSHGYTAFSYSLKAIGSGVLYLSLWAAYDLYHLIPSGVAFFAMILVTAWNGFMSWIQDSELLALYAMIGGFCTPMLVSTGENHELILFGYLLALDLSVLALISLRRWTRLVLGAFMATILMANGWATRFYSDQAFVLTAVFIAAFFLLFAFAPRLLRGLDNIAQETKLAAWDALVLLVLPLANAAIGFLAFYWLLDPSGRQWARPWVAVTFAAFYLLLLHLQPEQPKSVRASILSSLHLTSSVVLLTIAVPLQAHGYWLAIGWLVEGAALVWVALRFPALLLLRALAAGTLLLGFYELLTVNADAFGMIVFNVHFATYCVGIAAFSIVAWLTSKATPSAALSRTSAGSELSLADILIWTHFVVAGILAVNVLILLAVSSEIHAYWTLRTISQHFPQNDVNSLIQHRIHEQFSYSIWSMLFGATLLSVGFWKRSAFFRWQALILIVASIGKVFLVDITELSQGYRIISFLGLGVLLLTVSFAYQRGWITLRPYTADPASEPSTE